MTVKNELLLLFLAVTVLIACKKESVIKEKKENFKLTIASGGGFTGLYKGYRLHSEGQVMRWQRFGAGRDSVLWEAQGNSAQIHAFKQQLEESGALKQAFRQTGNMTTLVTLELPDTKYTWTWPGTGVSENTPDLFKKWYPVVDNYCNGLRQN